MCHCLCTFSGDASVKYNNICFNLKYLQNLVPGTFCVTISYFKFYINFKNTAFLPPHSETPPFQQFDSMYYTTFQQNLTLLQPVTLYLLSSSISTNITITTLSIAAADSALSQSISSQQLCKSLWLTSCNTPKVNQQQKVSYGLYIGLLPNYSVFFIPLSFVLKLINIPIASLSYACYRAMHGSINVTEETGWISDDSGLFKALFQHFLWRKYSDYMFQYFIMH